jgi:hypothetical protein
MFTPSIPWPFEELARQVTVCGDPVAFVAVSGRQSTVAVHVLVTTSVLSGSAVSPAPPFGGVHPSELLEHRVSRVSASLVLGSPSSSIHARYVVVPASLPL